MWGRETFEITAVDNINIIFLNTIPYWFSVYTAYACSKRMLSCGICKAAPYLVK